MKAKLFSSSPSYRELTLLNMYISHTILLLLIFSSPVLITSYRLKRTSLILPQGKVSSTADIHPQICPVWSVLRQNLLSDVVKLYDTFATAFNEFMVFPQRSLGCSVYGCKRENCTAKENWNCRRIVQTLDFEKIALYSGKSHLEMETIMKLLLLTELTSNCSKHWSKKF